MIKAPTSRKTHLLEHANKNKQNVDRFYKLKCSLKKIVNSNVYFRIKKVLFKKSVKTMKRVDVFYLSFISTQNPFSCCCSLSNRQVFFVLIEITSFLATPAPFFYHIHIYIHTHTHTYRKSAGFSSHKNKQTRTYHHDLLCYIFVYRSG